MTATSGSDTVQGSPTSTQGRFMRKPKQKRKQPKAEDARYCEVIGLSISDDAPGDPLTAKDFSFSERSMEKYVTKFPYGKFFSFTETGSGVSSGDDKSEVEPVEAVPRPNDSLPKPGKGKRQKFIPIELLKVLPAVRTLIFLPLWDAAAERWIAGGFIWTSKSNYLTSPHNELPYLKAFGNSITSEHARMNALIADRAKSDFISSISHELRSPLHGILGSVEFINETDITDYQAGLITAIETCSKTLLETLEHILDYAKINKLYSRDRGSRKPEARLRKKEIENSIMGPTMDVDINQIFEEVSESVCAGHAFRETHAGPEQELQKPQAPCNLAHLSISVEINPRIKNLVRTQPGAIRRLVMNVLGNALKYTDEGYIAVVMSANPSKEADKVDIQLTFKDTGRGISTQFQKTRLWSPFSQGMSKPPAEYADPNRGSIHRWHWAWIKYRQAHRGLPERKY
jgi:signal transduction histidine kinase